MIENYHNKDENVHRYAVTGGGDREWERGREKKITKNSDLVYYDITRKCISHRDTAYVKIVSEN